MSPDSFVTYLPDRSLFHILMNESCRPFPVDAYVVSAGAVVHTLNRFGPHLPATRDLFLRAEEVVRFGRVIHVNKGESADELVDVPGDDEVLCAHRRRQQRKEEAHSNLR